MENPEQEQKSSKQYSKKDLGRWALIAVCVLFGLTNLFSAPLSGVLLILTALFLSHKATDYLQHKFNFKLSSNGRIGVVVALLILSGVSMPATQSNPEMQNQQVAVTPTPQAVPEQTHTFNISSLIGKDMDELTAVLGAPSKGLEPTAEQLKLGTETWEKSWTKGEYELMATYDIQTKTVVDLFLGTNTDAAFALFGDTNNILKTGNLSQNDPRYSVEFVKALKGNGYTGAIVKKK